MIRFNRLVLILRIVLLLVFVNAIIVRVPDYVYYIRTINKTLEFFSIDWVKTQSLIIPLIFTTFLIPTSFRLIGLIFTESIDVKINHDTIILKNIITRREKIIHKTYISGYRIEKFNWNFIKIWGIRSFWEYESNMIVIFSKFRACVHLKSFNYFGINKIKEKLDENEYPLLLRGQRFFNQFNLRIK